MDHTEDDMDMTLDVPMTPLKPAATPSPARFSGSRPSVFSGLNLPTDVKMALNDAHGVCRQMSTVDAPCSSAAAAAVDETKLGGDALSRLDAIIGETPIVQIQNIVATCNLGTTLDLKHLALHARNAEYNPKRFSAVIMRIREPRTTALIFGSGKVVVTGAKSEADCKLASRKYGRIIQKLGVEVKFLDFKIQNMVGSTDVRFAIHLEALFITHSQFATYEPELFPGLIYRMVNPRVVLLIFVSGKIVITGARTREAIQAAFRQIYPVVKSFKK